MINTTKFCILYVSYTFFYQKFLIISLSKSIRRNTPSNITVSAIHDKPLFFSISQSSVYIDSIYFIFTLGSKHTQFCAYHS